MKLTEILEQNPKGAKAYREYVAPTNETWKKFEYMPLSMQWGLLLAFFDEQGIKMFIYPSYDEHEELNGFSPSIGAAEMELHIYETREAAQLSALTAAFELLEAQL